MNEEVQKAIAEGNAYLANEITANVMVVSTRYFDEKYTQNVAILTAIVFPWLP